MPSLWLLFRVWFLLGLQSFGGGGATLTLMRRALIERYHWITADEFARDWAVCQLCPGINQLAFSVLVGRRIAGWPGIFLCLFGLLLPSVTITVLLTAFYAHIRDSEIVKAALQAVVPASVGLGLLAAYEMVKSPLRAYRSEGKGWLLFSLLLLIGSCVVFLIVKPPVLLILASTGVLAALVNWSRCHFTQRKEKTAC